MIEYAIPTQTLGERGFDFDLLTPERRAELIDGYREMLFGAINARNDAEREYLQRCLEELGARP